MTGIHPAMSRRYPDDMSTPSAKPRCLSIRLPRLLSVGLAAVVLSLGAAFVDDVADDPAEDESRENARLPPQQIKLAAARFAMRAPNTPRR